jgi:membrane protein YqaA with SNARE-associated domain
MAPADNPSPNVPTNPLAVGAVVMSASSLVVCGPAGAVGWYLGKRAQDQIDASPEPQRGRRLARVAQYVGIAAVVIWVVAVVLVALLGGD